MKLSKYLLLLVIVVCFTQPACKKDKSNDNTELQARMEYLTAKPWKLVGFRTRPFKDNEWEDAFNTYAPCQVDDIYIFNKDNTIVKNFGSVKCSTDETVTTLRGTWTWYVVGTAIRTKNIGFDDAFIFMQLDANKMVLMNDFANAEYTFIHP